jgi:prepilin-type N-terminal cleavage/methylation domain-containing protein
MKINSLKLSVKLRVLRMIMKRKTSRQHFIKQGGFSLIELMVALAVSSIVSLGVMRINENMTKTVTRAQTDTDFRYFVDGVLKRALTSRNNCSLNFANGAPHLAGNPTNIAIDNDITTLNILQGRDVENRSLSISKLASSDPVANDLSASVIALMDTTADVPGSIVAGRSWKVDAMTLKPFIADSIGSPVGICPFEVRFQRNRGIGAGRKKMYFGPEFKKITLHLSCTKEVDGTGILTYIKSCKLAASNAENTWKQRFSANLDTYPETSTGAYIYYDENPGLGGFVTIGPIASDYDADPTAAVDMVDEEPQAPLEIYARDGVWLFPVFSRAIEIPKDHVYTFNQGAWGIYETGLGSGAPGLSCLAINKWDDLAQSSLIFAQHCQIANPNPGNDVDDWKRMHFSEYYKGVRSQRGELKIYNGNINIGALTGNNPNTPSNEMEIPGANALGYSRASEIITNSVSVGTGNKVLRPNSAAVGMGNEVERKFSYAFGVFNKFYEPSPDFVTPANEMQLGSFAWGVDNVSTGYRNMAIGVAIEQKRSNVFSIGSNITDHSGHTLPYGLLTLPTGGGNGGDPLAYPLAGSGVVLGNYYFNPADQLIYRAHDINNIGGGYNGGQPDPADFPDHYSVAGFNYSIGDNIVVGHHAFSSFALGEDLTVGSNVFTVGRNMLTENKENQGVMIFGIDAVNTLTVPWNSAGDIDSLSAIGSLDQYFSLFYGKDSIRMTTYGDDGATTYRNILRISAGGNLETGDVAPASETDDLKKNNFDMESRNIDLFASTLAAYNSNIGLEFSTIIAGQNNTLTYTGAIPTFGVVQPLGNAALIGSNDSSVDCAGRSGVLSGYGATLTCRPAKASLKAGSYNMIAGGGEQKLTNVGYKNAVIGGGVHEMISAVSSINALLPQYLEENLIAGGYTNTMTWSDGSSAPSTPRTGLKNNAIIGSFNSTYELDFPKSYILTGATGGLYPRGEFNTILSSRNTTLKNSELHSIVSSHTVNVNDAAGGITVNSREINILGPAGDRVVYRPVIIGSYDVTLEAGTETPNQVAWRGNRPFIMGSAVKLNSSYNGTTKGAINLQKVFTGHFTPSSPATYTFPPDTSEARQERSMVTRFENHKFCTDSSFHCMTLNLGSTWWIAPSSRKIKEQLQDVDDDWIIDKVLNLEFKRWSYIGNFESNISGERITSISPFSEDYYKAFKVGEANTHIAAASMTGVGVKMLQALKRKTDEIQALFKYQETFLGQIHSFVARVKVKLDQFLERRHINRARIKRLKRALAQLKQQNIILKESL